MSISPFLLLVVSVASILAGCADAPDAVSPAQPRGRGQTTAPRELTDDSVGVSLTAPIRRAPPQFDDADNDSIRLFHDVLAPYGSWVDDSRLGLVWIPSRDLLGEDFARSFVPYATHGRWTYREVAAASDGNGSLGGTVNEYVWVSDLPWGWVTFHYGRWAFVGDRGWAWVAGRRYAGAWVDWRTPGAHDSIVGWGPMPPSLVWRIAPEHVGREAMLVAVPYAAFATPYTYARTKDLFAADLGAKLLPAAAALAVAHNTEPGAAPNPTLLGFHSEDVPAPPMLDRGLQQAWMLATPASASAVGLGPELPSPPRLRTWVAGGPRWASHR